MIDRDHMLDLRQPNTNTSDDYRWGWIDEDRQILFACFNVLIKYVNAVNASRYHYNITDESMNLLQSEIDMAPPSEKAALINQLKVLREVKALYEYWTTIRKEELITLSYLLHDWCKCRRNNKMNNDNAKWNLLTAANEVFDCKEEEMLMRLMKIRRCLWT